MPPDEIILESMGVGLMAVDEACRIVRFNASAEQLTGLTAAEVMGQLCSAVLKTSLCSTRCPVREALATGTTCRYGTVILQTRDSRFVNVEVIASAMMDHGGRIVGAVELLRDLSAEPGQVRIYGSRVFVSRNQAMRHIFDSLPSLAGSRAPLLIMGGQGSGRSALAETIHVLGDQGGPRPLVALRCSTFRTLPPGHQSSPIVRAGGGTLVLEDVGEAPLSLQQRLLAWLEEGEEALGVRVISTATPRIEARLDEGTFRRDLYYRLNVLHVAIPPLRERIEDIPLIVEQILEELGHQRGDPVEGITAAAMGRLMGEDLPGNVRQLRLTLARALARRPGGLIDEGDLMGTVEPPPEDRKALKEREAILAALGRAGGSVTRAARELKMHRTTLWRKIKRYGIRVGAPR